MSLLSKKLLPKNLFFVKRLFFSVCSQEGGGQTVNLDISFRYFGNFDPKNKKLKLKNKINSIFLFIEYNGVMTMYIVRELLPLHLHANFEKNRLKCRSYSNFNPRPCAAFYSI